MACRAYTTENAEQDRFEAFIRRCSGSGIRLRIDPAANRARRNRFFTGLLVALPLSAALWALIIWRFL